MDNQTRRILLERVKASGFPGSILDVFQNPAILDQFIAEQQQSQLQQPQNQPVVAQTPQEQEQGLRPAHAAGDVGQSMIFPNVEPNQSFNTVGMKIPIDINKVDNQGNLVESYKAVPPGIQDLPTGPNRGMVIESPAEGYAKTGGVRKYQTGSFDVERIMADMQYPGYTAPTVDIVGYKSDKQKEKEFKDWEKSVRSKPLPSGAITPTLSPIDAAVGIAAGIPGLMYKGLQTGIPALASTLNTPVVIGPTTLPRVTMGNILGAAGAAHSTQQILDPSSELRTNPNAENALMTGLGFVGLPYKTAALSFADDLGQAGKYLTTQTPLKNAYKYNPWANKVNPNLLIEDPAALYRGIGKSGKENLLQSKILTSADIKSFPEPYFVKGSPPGAYGQGYIAEVKNEPSTFKGFGLNNEEIFTTKPVNLENPNLKIYQSTPEGYRELSKTTGLPIQQKPHWLRGYKEVPKPTSVSSSLDNVENIFSGNHLTDKERKMYKWFDDQLKFDKLPKTENKESLGVLEDFKTRIQTPEGQRRLKELGIDSDEFLQKLEIVEDPNTYGYYAGHKNRIVMNPNSPLPRKVTRHEIEHGVQSARKHSEINKVINASPDEKLRALESDKTEIDNLLSGLQLRKEGTPNKVWDRPLRDQPVDISQYKSLVSNKQNATDYFLTGSGGREKSAFLGEVQQYMMDQGILPKTSYVEVTPEMVKDTFTNAVFDETGGGKYLRLFQIMKPTEANYKLIADNLNKMLGVAPVIGLGTAATLQKQQQKTGGVRTYLKGGLKNRVLYNKARYKR